MLFLNLPRGSLFNKSPGRNFPILFASPDRNPLWQITYITLASLYPSDVPHCPGMTVTTAITASFEDTEKLYDPAKTSNFRVLSSLLREICIFAVSVRTRAVTIIRNYRKNAPMFFK